MSQDPNAWWSKEIGNDLNKGMHQGLVDSKRAWSKKSPQERRRAVMMMISIFVVEGGIAYGLYRLVIRYAYSR